MAFVLVESSDWAVAHGFGVLQWLPEMPLWAFALVGMLLLDLVGAYFVHWTEHKVRWMWRFHLVHHTDTHVDTTTANRHHPGESVFRFVFTTAAVVLAGAPMWLVFFYQGLSVALSQFNHANINLPDSVDRVLSWLIVTPQYAPRSPPLRAALHGHELRQYFLGMGPAVRYFRPRRRQQAGVWHRHAHGAARK